MQAEQVGEDSGGKLGGEVEEGGAAAGLGVDTEGPEPSAERVRGDGTAGQMTGEQPGGLLRGADAAVTAPVVDELGDGDGEWSGDGHVVAAEPDEHLLTAAGDLAGGHDGDAGQWLAVKQQQAAGDPVGGVERIVVQKPGSVCPSLVLADGGSGCPFRGRDVQPLGVPAGGSPDQEVPGQAR